MSQSSARVPRTPKKIPIPEFLRSTSRAVLEEQVVDSYMKILGIGDLERPFGSDGYCDGTLFEFKFNFNLKSPRRQAHGLAQACYYLRRFLKEGVYGGRAYDMPRRAALCSRGSAMVVLTEDLAPFFDEETYDWNRAPSSPDPKLVEALTGMERHVCDMTRAEGVQGFLDQMQAVGGVIRKIITRDNFDAVFEVWKAAFAPNEEPHKAAHAYILDLQLRGSINEVAGTVLFDYVDRDGRDSLIRLRVPLDAYNAFWKAYKRPPDNEEMEAILERKDRLIAIQKRRFDGEFYTPLPYARLAHDTLAGSIPDRYEGSGSHHSMYDDYTWWDTCCGTGNLTYHCPSGMAGDLFLSTLHESDLAIVQESGQNPNATLFQYDFLNGTEWEIPEVTRKKLEAGGKWIFILNPPFAAAAGDACASDSDGARAQMANTLMRTEMEPVVGYACRNLFAQFLYRIARLVEKYRIEAVVAAYTPTLWLGGIKYEEFRCWWDERFGFSDGFCFPSWEFYGSKGKWPVALGVWKSGAETSFVELDIYDTPTTKRGRKVFSPPIQPLSEWVDRPTATTPAVPLTSGIQPQKKGQKAYKKSIAYGALGYLVAHSNDVQQSQQLTILLSSVFSAPQGGWSILPETFLESMVVFAIRRLVQRNWLNWQDNFSVPNLTHADYPQFARDAAAWSLFSPKNQAAGAELVYEGTTYTLRNEFFPLTIEEFRSAIGLPQSTWRGMRDDEDRFVALWLRDQNLSPDVERLLRLGKDLFIVGAGKRAHADPVYQLVEHWDAGWYQLRMGLYEEGARATKTPEMEVAWKEFAVQYQSVTRRLRPLVYGLGALPKEMLFEVIPEGSLTFEESADLAMVL
jgi:hypothetical protein